MSLRRSGAFIVNLEYVSLVFVLLTLNMYVFTGLEFGSVFMIVEPRFDHPCNLK